MVVAQDKVVSIHYTLTNDAGKVLDSSSGGEPLAYIHGQGNLISGLEKALEGKQAGDKLNVDIAPTMATACATRRSYSACRCERLATSRTSKPGMQFQAQTRKASTQVVTVTRVSRATWSRSTRITRWRARTCISTSRSPRFAKPSRGRMAHGHVHGPGGHHHHD